MGPFKKLFGLGLTLMLDIGSGILMTHLLWWALGLHIHWYHYLSGIIFAKLPDVDEVIPFAIELLGGPENDSSHKSLPTHYPLLVIPAVTGVALLVAPWPYALLAGVCLFVHFFHDSWQSQEDGPGIRWLAPFGKRYYQVLSRHGKGEPIRLLLVVSPEHLEHAFGITAEYWLNKTFFRFTWENAIGIALFFVGITVLIQHFLL